MGRGVEKFYSFSGRVLVSEGFVLYKLVSRDMEVLLRDWWDFY